MIRQIYVLVLFLMLSTSKAQPKFSVDIGLGFYQPTLTGFDEYGVFTANKAGEDIVTRNILTSYGMFYEFFYNARIGITTLNSSEIKNNITLNNSAVVDFERKLTYRLFPVETFFRWRPKIEFNFTLMPIWCRGSILLITTPSQQADDWNSFVNEFNEIKDQIVNLDASDKMVSNWFGYGSMLGIRYYITSRMAVDFKSGFMNQNYDRTKWSLRGKSISGPELKLDDLPTFTLKFLYGFQ